MELVTCVNRSSKEIKGIWDGKPNIIPPHGRAAFPLLVAEAMKRQNVVMGSEDPYTGDMDYLVAILEQGDDETPMEQTIAITRMNRKLMGKNEEVVKGDNGLYSRREVTQTLPLDSTFAKP